LNNSRGRQIDPEQLCEDACRSVVVVVRAQQHTTQQPGEGVRQVTEYVVVGDVLAR
ncbi:hypothetical protein SARC_14617, partial [Sphaeroforma arctica JP610]